VDRGSRRPPVALALSLATAVLVAAAAPLGCGLLKGCRAKYPNFRARSYLVGDAHEHIKSRRQLNKLLDFMDRNGIWWSVLAAASDKTNLGPDADFTGYTENNETVLNIAATHPARLVPFITFDPKSPRKEKRVAYYLDRGARGIMLYHGHSDFYTTRLDTPELFEVYDLAYKAGVPVLMHINTHKYLDQLDAVLGRMSKVKFICAHLCMSFTRPSVLERLLNDHDNLYVDLSFGHPDYIKEAFGWFGEKDERREELRHLIEAHPDRFLFGSDLVFTDHPQKNKAWLDAMAGSYFSWLGAKKLKFGLPAKDDFPGLALSEETLEKIYSTNFREVILGGESLGDPKDEAVPNPKGLRPGDSDSDEVIEEK